MKEFYDIEIKCECGSDFIWTAGEQSFMQKLHEEGKIEQINKPKRCPDCRAKKKRKFEEQGQR